MDYNKLIKPYAEPTQKGGTERTPELQRVWLQKKGIPPELIDSAMYVVYARLEGGKTYPSGHDLDRALLAEALKQNSARQKALVKVSQRTANQLIKHGAPKLHAKCKARYAVGGFALGLFVAWFISTQVTVDWEALKAWL